MQRLVLGLALAGAVAMLPLVMRAQGQAPAQQPPAPRPTTADPTHPPLLDRLSIVQSYPGRPLSPPEHAPASTTLGDLDTLEQMLHNHLFGVPAVEPSVFHRAGS